MNLCPDCRTELKYDSVVRVLENGFVKVIGHYQFCPNMNCKFETE